ncbi:RNA binding protein fox-1-like protein 2 [Platysternon megacephalum]|uniref:RNA binding protein fox-1-like protein 2 n=1 Tax=Platysternon megacephalum TaxID=55544 RepID=A0A4D9DV04_9SAUR|nr:RNA binding protein fox-1-like protein 2 [Platysternon megacephalum]
MHTYSFVLATHSISCSTGQQEGSAELLCFPHTLQMDGQSWVLDSTPSACLPSCTGTLGRVGGIKYKLAQFTSSLEYEAPGAGFVSLQLTITLLGSSKGSTTTYCSLLQADD